MKIEKLSDNQIRCTLTHADLANRQMKLSELVSGSEKAKSLFHDMMTQAAFEFGFEAEDMPLMIEAIPSSSDGIVLIITKVEDPEELDAKYSKYSSTAASKSHKRKGQDKLIGAGDFLDLYQKIKEAVGPFKDILPDVENLDLPASESSEDSELSHIRLFSFGSLDGVIHASKLIQPLYKGSNTLYKDTEEGSYVLAITQSELATSAFNKICNMLSEYSSSVEVSSVILAFLEEHCDVIVSQNAVEQLGSL